MFKLMRQLKL